MRVGGGSGRGEGGRSRGVGKGWGWEVEGGREGVRVEGGLVRGQGISKR